MSEMNETNHRNEIEPLEARLRSWVPRRPSARVEKRLFGPKVEAAEPRGRFRVSWLAPVTAAVLLTFVLVRQHEGQALSGAASTNWMVAMMLSNRSVSAYSPVSYTIEQNRLPEETFEWTISGASTSSIAPLSSARRAE